LIVHSSLSSFGHLEGGAETLISALQSAVTLSGLLMMPAFTYGRTPYDPGSTPTPDGVVAETFRHHPGVVRSHHPTHSVAAWGVGAAEAVADHAAEWPCGRGGPLHRLALRGGAILLVGVGHRANSLIHVAQALAEVPYLDRYRDAPVMPAGGTVRYVRVRRAGCSRGFDREAAAFRSAALIAEAEVGSARLALFQGVPLLEAAEAILRRDPFSLLCLDPDCSSCNEARTMSGAPRLA
jgi:aminoglycoside 3-N-acetyltransferase